MATSTEFEQTVESGAGTRLDVYLAANREELSRAYVQQLIDRGCVLVNEKQQKASYKLRKGDRIRAHIPEPAALEAHAEDLPLDILYEDEDVLVVNKPRGMVTHPAPGSPDHTLVNAVLYHCDSFSSIGGAVRPGIVHRLDKDTSGVMVVAKNDLAHQSLSRQIAERTVDKEYVALVTGIPRPERGTIRTNLARSRQDYKKIVVAPAGRPAVTHYEVLEDLGSYALVRLHLETGRTHQIRVHMQHIGHPVVGDPVYGPRKGLYAGRGQFLHARQLAFDHPRTGKRMQFEAPLPEDFTQALGEMRRRSSETLPSRDTVSLAGGVSERM